MWLQMYVEYRARQKRARSPFSRARLNANGPCYPSTVCLIEHGCRSQRRNMWCPNRVMRAKCPLMTTTTTRYILPITMHANHELTSLCSLVDCGDSMAVSLDMWCRIQHRVSRNLTRMSRPRSGKRKRYASHSAVCVLRCIVDTNCVL